MNQAYLNLATEEYLLNELDCSSNDYVFIYVNNPAVVVGRNQNIYEEIDIKYCNENQIQICRRISGGGTVFHDKGNINIAIFSSRKSDRVNNYAFFMKDLFSFLNLYGVKAYLNERNSIYCGDKKLGGNAQFTNRDKIISHCTLLFSTDKIKLEKSIQSPFNDIKSVASKSVRSNIMNLSEVILDKSFDEFYLELNNYFANHSALKPIILSESILNSVKSQYLAKFESFDWIYARSPKCEIQVKNEKFTINKGKIESASNSNLINLEFLPEDKLADYF